MQGLPVVSPCPWSGQRRNMSTHTPNKNKNVYTQYIIRCIYTSTHIYINIKTTRKVSLLGNSLYGWLLYRFYLCSDGSHVWQVMSSVTDLYSLMRKTSCLLMVGNDIVALEWLLSGRYQSIYHREREKKRNFLPAYNGARANAGVVNFASDL